MTHMEQIELVQALRATREAIQAALRLLGPEAS
jgi:hypothetical protein